jgi:hypothetical protein
MIVLVSNIVNDISFSNKSISNMSIILNIVYPTSEVLCQPPKSSTIQMT